ncbi:MAG: hypothetical protein IT262_14230 [Saprospiraceae bacterium]|nr:hypothetical protein [Saprospiraceae bacterium]
MKNVILFLFLLVTLKTAAQKGDTLFNDNKCPTEVQYHGVKFNSPVFDGHPLPWSPPAYPPPVAFGPTGLGDRYIHWVHGLDGSEGSWAQAAAATETGGDNGDPIVVTPPGGTPFDFVARKVRTKKHTYGEVDFAPAILDLQDEMEQVTYPVGHTFERDFIIAHSQGGIVSRGLDHRLTIGNINADRYFSGIATFNTSHGGAQILNSRENGLLNEMISDLCTVALTTTLAETLQEKAILDLFINQSAANDSIRVFCDTKGVSLAGLFLSSLAKPKTLSASYAVGAPDLEGLNAAGNPGLYKAAFYGVEYSDGDNNMAQPKQLLWRLLSSFGSEATNADPFTADLDNKLVDSVSNIMAEWEGKYNYFDGILADGVTPACGIFGWIFLPGPCAVATVVQYNVEQNNAIDQRETYREALEWLNGVDDQWATIIGARENVFIQGNNECVCTQWTDNGQALSTTSYFLDNPEDCNSYNSGTYDQSSPFYTSCMVPPVYEVQWKESDGVVLRESQRAFPGVGVQGVRRLEKMNHFQVRNSSETAIGLNALFNGEVGNDPQTRAFFKTDKKQ